MRVLQNTYPTEERVIALGTFDGVHRGHESLIRSAKQLANEMEIKLKVCTFNHHPLEVLCPDHPPELLSTVPEKAALMCRLGVDEMELMHFDRRTADMEPEDYLKRLRKMNKVRAVVAGWNYTFGRKGRGDAELLKADGKTYGYRVLIVPPETLEDRTAISSSLVRKMLKEGRIGETRNLLGHEYTITGTVVEGKHKGRILGFPTANIEPWKRKALPKFGVYTCLLNTGDQTFPAVANIGNQPTMPSGHVTVETHALEEGPALYGLKVRLTLLTMLRDEKRFDSPEALREQIEKDRNKAMKYFDMA